MRVPRTCKKMVHLGNGDWSLARMYELHVLLDDAFTYLSGLQQGGKDDGEGEMVIEGACRDIVCALTGLEFNFMPKETE